MPQSNKNLKLQQLGLVFCLLVVVVAAVSAAADSSLLQEAQIAFDESPSSMMIEDDIDDDDDRTLLDVFGQVAKTYLTQHAIPPTDEDCRWDWRVLRCEPYCECHLQFHVGDYHLGRSCRRRVKQTTTTEESCSIPPPHQYAQTMEVLIRRTQQITQQTKIVTQRAINRTRERLEEIQNNVCDDLPVDCNAQTETGEDSDNSSRNWKQQLLCRHIPEPCEQEEDVPSASIMDRISAAVNMDNNNSSETTAVNESQEQKQEEQDPSH